MSLTSIIRFVRALDTSSTTGDGKTGLTHSDITASCIKPGGTLTSLTTETITTLGTYEAPTSSAHIRIKEVSSSNPAKGIYEIHIHDSTISSGSHIVLMFSATGAAFVPLEIDLANVTGRIPTALTSNGNIKSSLLEIIANSLTETSAGYLAAAFKKLFDVATPVLTAASVNQTGDSYAVVNSGTYGNAAIKTTADAAASYIDTEIGMILSNVTDILAAVDTEISTLLTRVDVAVSTRSVAGDAMTLTTGERTAIANEVEAQIIDDTDSERVLTAITDKIAAVNPSLDDLTLSAIASAIRTELATELARIDATVSSRATPAQVNEQADTAIADVGLTSIVTGRIDQAVSAAKTLTSAYDAAKTAATQTSLDSLQESVDGLGSGIADDVISGLNTSGVTVTDIGSSALQQLGELGTIRVEQPMVTESTITLRQGDDYLEDDSRQLQFLNTQGTWPNLTDAECILELIINSEKYTLDPGTVVVAVGVNQRVDIEVPRSITSQLNYSLGRFELTATLSTGSMVTLRVGVLNTILNN